MNIYYLNRRFVCYFFLSSVALLLSFNMEHIFSIKPCRLCHYQRNIYILIFALSVTGFFSSYKKYAYSLLMFFFLLNLLVSTNHFMIQMDFIQESCNLLAPKGILDFQKMIFDRQESCATSQWLFLKIPISFYNALISIFCLMAETKNLIKSIAKKNLIAN